MERILLNPRGSSCSFPDIRAARTVEDSLYLVVLILWIAHFLALYRALRGTSLAPSLLGASWALWVSAFWLPELCRMSLASLSPSSIMLLVRPPRIRHLALLLQATEGIFDALFGVGLLLVPMSFAALGVGMLGARPSARALAR